MSKSLSQRNQAARAAWQQRKKDINAARGKQVLVSGQWERQAVATDGQDQ